MTKSALLIAVFIMTALFAGFLMFGVAQAQGLVPCTNNCNSCHVTTLAQNIINLFMYLVVVVATLMFVFAGFKYITAGSNTGQISQAHSIFWNVLVGLIIVLAAWLIVDTIMKTLYSGKFGPWNTILCTGVSTTGGPSYSYQSPSTGTPYSQGSYGRRPPPSGTLTHATALQRLQAAGITVTSSSGAGGVRASCAGLTRCTTLTGVRESSINQIIAFRRACNCAITITGATEPGHAGGRYSHANGYKIDIRPTSGITNYIQNNTTRAGSRGGDPRYRDRCGNEYVREGNHWDITVLRPCS